MAAKDSFRRSLAARIAINQRWHPDKPELVAEDQRTLKAILLAEQIHRAVQEEPVLTADQVAEATALLTGGAG
jgi:hypothetical protein